MTNVLHYMLVLGNIVKKTNKKPNLIRAHSFEKKKISFYSQHHLALKSQFSCLSLQAEGLMKYDNYTSYYPGTSLTPSKLQVSWPRKLNNTESQNLPSNSFGPNTLITCFLLPTILHCSLSKLCFSVSK